MRDADDAIDGTSQKHFVTERRRGRPRAEQEMTTISTWIPASYHDRLIRLANKREQSVSSLVRQLLILRLPDSR